MGLQAVVIDGVKWVDAYPGQTYKVRLTHLQPLCLKHSFRLTPHGGSSLSTTLKCSDEGGHNIKLPRAYIDEKEHALNKIDALTFAKIPVINLDDQAIPVAKETLKDTDYWVEAKVTESKSGTRLIVWAGSKKDKNKTQLFVEPGIKRMSFDQNDDHPNEVFTKVEATFKDDIKSGIKKEK